MNINNDRAPLRYGKPHADNIVKRRVFSNWVLNSQDNLRMHCLSQMHYYMPKALRYWIPRVEIATCIIQQPSMLCKKVYSFRVGMVIYRASSGAILVILAKLGTQ